MSGSTLRSLHGALRQSQRRVSSGLSLLTPWTKQAGECSRYLQTSGPVTSWTRHMAMAQRIPVCIARPAPIQIQTRQVELSRGYATSAQAEKETPAAVAAAEAVPEISLPLASILRQMSAAAAPSHPSVYATVHIFGRPYLVTPGDRLRLPFRMAGVQPGDILCLDRVGVVGSRSLTAVGAAVGTDGFGGHVSGVTVTAVVLGLEAEPLRVLIKKKRRNRRKRSVRSKHQYTVLRIQDIDLGEQST